MSRLITEGRYAGLILKSGNRSGVGGIADGPGIVTTTGPAAVDILHLVPLGRSFYVTKVMWYFLAPNSFLDFGSLNATPALVQMFPRQLVLAGIPGGLLEEELVGVEFMLNSQALPGGWDGSLYVTSSVAGVQISVEVAEKG